VTPRRRPPERGRSEVFSGLVLIEGGELIPMRVSEGSERTEARAERPREPRSLGAQSEVRESVGRTLRRAFPLPDSGSFAGLLGRLEEA
jgi:hypothetical protein